MDACDVRSVMMKQSLPVMLAEKRARHGAIMCFKLTLRSYTSWDFSENDPARAFFYKHPFRML